MRLVLASASPRRAELLRAAGFEFDVMVSNVDETSGPDETPDAYVRRLAQGKAESVGRQVPGRPVLAADTIVVVNSTILQKPNDDPEAARMLRLLSGREHLVITAVCLLSPSAGSRRVDVAVARTVVEFAPMDAAEVDWYVRSGEGRDKAGGYAIQGLASRFVRRIEGSYSNVVGLPVALVYDLCKRAGILVF